MQSSRTQIGFVAWLASWRGGHKTDVQRAKRGYPEKRKKEKLDCHGAYAPRR
jgi:hypothetical protein